MSDHRCIRISYFKLYFRVSAIMAVNSGVAPHILATQLTSRSREGERGRDCGGTEGGKVWGRCGGKGVKKKVEGEGVERNAIFH